MADYLAKQALVTILSSVLGRVLDVDFEKVQVSVWQGTIELEDVALRPDAVEHLLEDYGGGASLPVTMVSGSVRKISVTVPWGTLTSNPVRIVVEGVRLVACASDCDVGGRSPAKAGAAAAPATEAQEPAANAASASTKDASPAAEGSWASYFEQLGRQIADNIEISVADVVLEFLETGSECCSTVPGRTDAFSLSL